MQADLGIVFDTDVDRSAVVASSGDPINSNKYIALMAYIALRCPPPPSPPGPGNLVLAALAPGRTGTMQNRQASMRTTGLRAPQHPPLYVSVWVTSGPNHRYTHSCCSFC